MVSLILKDNGWEESISHHGMEVIDGYELWINVRNPYDRVISMWRNNKMDFQRWIKTIGYVTPELDLIKQFDVSFNTIRCESLKEDLDKLNVVYREDLWDRLNQGVKPWRLREPNLEWTWNEENVEIVWENLKEYFEVFGYKRDSWK